jgi:hypothetical protein
MKLPLLHKVGYTPIKDTLGNCHRNSIGRMPGNRPLLSLDTSLAIPTRVLRFEASRCPMTRNRSARFWPDSHARSLALALWLSRVTQWFSGEPLQTPRT